MRTMWLDRLAGENEVPNQSVRAAHGITVNAMLNNVVLNMWDWLGSPAVQALLAVTTVLAVVYFGLQALIALRPSTSKDVTNAYDLSRNFEEMQLEGDISDEELRTIRSVIGKTQSRRTSEPLNSDTDKRDSDERDNGIRDPEIRALEIRALEIRDTGKP